MRNELNTFSSNAGFILCATLAFSCGTGRKDSDRTQSRVQMAPEGMKAEEFGTEPVETDSVEGESSPATGKSTDGTGWVAPGDAEATIAKTSQQTAPIVLTTDAGTQPEPIESSADHNNSIMSPLQSSLNFALDPTLLNLNVRPQNTLSISGACSSGDSITLLGDLRDPELQLPVREMQTSCLDGRFEFPLALTDGLHDLTLRSLLGTPPILTFSIEVDTIKPSAIVLSNPLIQPVVTGDAQLTVSGRCEPGANVRANGSFTASSSCSSEGTFSLHFEAETFATYTISLSQIDGAGNESVSTQLDWHFTSHIPPQPIVVSPASPLILNSTRSLDISGSCLSDHQVRIEATGLIGHGSVVSCSSGNFSFLLEQAYDGDHIIKIYQFHSLYLNESAPAILIWTVDTTSPEPVTIGLTELQRPGPLTLTGGCEPFAQISLTGASELTAVCQADGTFTLTFDQTTDGIYQYQLIQADKAGLSSASVALSWNRDQSLPPSPELLSPRSTTVIDRSDGLVLSGRCSDGMTVDLSGDVIAQEVVYPEGSLTQLCQAGYFMFTVRKGTVSVDTHYELSLRQTLFASSHPITIRWTRDVTAPVLQVLKQPREWHLEPSAELKFLVDDPQSELECRLNQGSWYRCSTDTSLELLQNGPQLFEMIARDLAGNASPAMVLQWQQVSFKTVSLFHFNETESHQDSGLYTASFPTNFSSVGTSSAQSGWFGPGIEFDRSRSSALRAPLSAPLQSLSESFTIESWLAFDAFSANASYTLVSTGSSGQVCLNLSISKQGGGQNRNRKLSLTVKLRDGNTHQLASSAFPVDDDRSRFYHIAAVFNRGDVRFFINGEQRGSGVIGVLGASRLSDCEGSIVIGQNVNGQNSLDGVMDELRISRAVRYTRNFVPSATPFLAD